MIRLNAKELKLKAAEARKLMTETLILAGCGHPGGAFSSVDVLVSLYFNILNIDPQNPKKSDRDIFILSKGHSSVALYTVLALRGFFDLEVLKTFRQDNSILGGHPDMHKVPGIEMSTGSLGHGLSAGIGISLADRLDKKDRKVFVMLGDGETQEGSIWEAAMSASHFQLANLVCIVDRNRIQIDGFTENIMRLESYKAKWEAFGWACMEIDGHNHEEIVKALNSVPFHQEKPSLIISNTIKGKGISFMENNPEWHGKSLKCSLSDQAIKEVSDMLMECKNDCK